MSDLIGKNRGKANGVPIESFPRSQLGALIEEVVQSVHSDFYRKKYSSWYSVVRPFTEDGWRRLPLLFREEVRSVPMWDRIFVKRTSVPFIRNTYGTSGTGILITPRKTYGNYKNPYLEMGYRRVMNFFASAHYGFPQVETGVQTWFGDVGNLELSGAIVKKARIEVLYITPYTALAIAPLLKGRGAIDMIKAVQLCGERCSAAQFNMLKNWYRNATVFANYSSSETRETVAVSCIHDRARGGSLVMSAVPEVYCEIVDPTTRAVVAERGIPGDLVVTTLGRELPFPLIRYRTGDIAEYVDRECACDITSRGFEVHGRATVFPVRMVKGELTVRAVENALNVLGLSCEYFEAHYIEEQKGATVLPRVRIVLTYRSLEYSSRQIANRIARRLFLFPSYTYADGVQSGLYLPLSVRFLKKSPGRETGKQKAPIVVRHSLGTGSKVQRAVAHPAIV